MSLPLNYGFAGGSRYGQYYKHSGQINVRGVIAALLVGAIAGSVLGGIYSASVVFIPFIKLRALASLGLGALLGLIPAGLLKKMHVRNLPISLAVVAVVSAVSLYISWAAWESLVLRNIRFAPSVWHFILKPKMVFDIAKVINQLGTWTIAGSEPLSGSGLLAIWIIEAAMVVVTALLTARSLLHDLPYCEKCQQWCGTAKTVRITAPTDIADLKSKLESGDFDYIRSLPAPRGNSMLTFTHNQCTTCQELNTLSVIARTVVTDKKGRAKSNKIKKVVNKLLVTTDDIAAIEIGKDFPAAAPTPVAISPPLTPSTRPERKPIKSPQAL